VPRTYLIDLYDTLVSSDWERRRAELSSEAGISVERLDRAFHQTLEARNTGRYDGVQEGTRAIVLAAGLPDDPEIVRRWVEMTERFMRDDVHLYGDSLPTVRALRDRGDRAVLVSNCSEDTRTAIDRLGLEEEFDALILSFEIGVRKPDPAIYRAALSAVAAHPSESLFVDDQIGFCDGARALGIDTRLIIRPGASPADVAAASANGHVTITRLAALLDA